MERAKDKINLSSHFKFFRARKEIANPGNNNKNNEPIIIVKKFIN